jgi:hypothetical protein
MLAAPGFQMPFIFTAPYLWKTPSCQGEGAARGTRKAYSPASCR